MRGERGIGSRGDRLDLRAHRFGDLEEVAARPGGRGDEDPAEPLGEEFERLLDAASPLEEPRAVAERVARPFVDRGRDDLEEDLVVGEPEDRLEHRGVDAPVGRGEQPVEEREPVAHRPVREARDREEDILGDLDPLAARDLAEVAGDLPRRDVAEVEALAARLDRLRDLVRLGRAEDELHMRRRLLHRLEEGVERRRRQHVDFVDDVDAELAAGRREAGARDQVARIVDAAVRGAVDLDDVEVLAAEDRLADRVALRERGVPVEGAREDARHRGLADAARAAEEVGVGGAPRRDRVLERAGDRLLSDDLAEVARAVAAREDRVGLRRGALGGRRSGVGGGCGGLLRHPSASRERNSGAAEDGQATVGSDRIAYGCCGQALTRFAADPPAGPGRLLRLQSTGW